jgi:hypothetical protein
MRDPPQDWPEKDHLASSFKTSTRLRPQLAHQFYIGAFENECLQAQIDQGTEFGQPIVEPELYLRFASERPTPSLILNLANRYGLLQFRQSRIAIRKTLANKILTYSRSPAGSPRSKTIYLRAEPAYEWMRTFGLMQFHLSAWSDLQELGPKALSGYLEEGVNYDLSGSLTFQVKMDVHTGQISSEIFASNLAHAIQVQWGISLAANVMHRQCETCSVWFAVHPSSGRPEKKFCSDACRMRAYRRRKNRKRSGSTNRSTKSKN